MTATVDSPDLRRVDLADRYAAQAGLVQLTGIQALARLPIDQHRRDLAAGRDVATFISGYEGSPLAGYDLELGRQRTMLDANDVVFVPGLNEEAAATAVQGSQLANTLDGALKDGVLGIWYGKAPGLDRAKDALRHGNLMGAHPAGGALVLVGDDPAAKSSSVPCASDLALADLMIPYLYPADSQDVIELGLHAVELSRASGLWVGMKIVTAVADGSSTVDLSHISALDLPEIPRGAKKHVPTARLLQPTLGPLERDLVTTRLRIAREYAALNGLNRVVGRSDGDTIGVVAAGRTWQDLHGALERLGLDEGALESSNVRLLKVGMPWPLNVDTVRDFSEGLTEILVLEEKRAFMESAVRDILYRHSSAPVVTGKMDDLGRDLVPAYGELDVDIILPRLQTRLAAHDVVAPADAAPAHRRSLLPLTPVAKRAPYFCSGCPHNSSTKPDDGSLVGGGIGCHAMVLMMDESQVGTVTGLSQMGGEGLQWIGIAPFVDRSHYVQNLGDGTFDHSGSLAIRAAVASGVNVTYKLLFNSAVAMTGGQRAVGGMDIEQVLDVLMAERVARVIVTTEDMRRYRRRRLPVGVQVWHRDRLLEAQRALAETPGVTVLVHDQECATEKRRKRKRGLLEQPNTRVFINERICEGCGDCGRKSNCLSVQPVLTELGRKTQIHQGSCNVDYSCLQGDCPALMTVVPAPGGGSAALGQPSLDATQLVDPVPNARVREAFGIRLTGVGGTGVVTVSQVLATAGLLAGWTARSLDQTGLAQKGGAVVSDVRFWRQGSGTSNKLAAGECDLYVGCDILVAADPINLEVVAPDRTVSVLNTAQVPTGHMVADVGLEFPNTDVLVAQVLDRSHTAGASLDARSAATRLLGDDQFTNIFLIGVGFQTGSIPLPAAAVEEAIRLNGVAVEKNVQAFRRGRQMVSDPEAFERALSSMARNDGPQDRWTARPGETDLERLVRTRMEDLVAYQDRRYAHRYEAVVRRVQDREAQVLPGSIALTEAVARHLYKLMAYKDEYEVARLALDPRVEGDIEAQFGAGAKTAWNLHPPALRAMGMDRKLRLGRWFTPAFKALVPLRRLRGTPLDPFGRAHVRRIERELVNDFVAVIEHICAGLTETSHATAVRIASLPDVVRGYEDVKLANVSTYREQQAGLLAEFETATQAFGGAAP